MTFSPFACGMEIQDPSLYKMIKYVFYELGSALELFLFTWPADFINVIHFKFESYVYLGIAFQGLRYLRICSLMQYSSTALPWAGFSQLQAVNPRAMLGRIINLAAMKRQQHAHSVLKSETVLRILRSRSSSYSGHGLLRVGSLSAEKDDLSEHSAKSISMKHRVTLETAIILTKFGLSPISCWPLPIGSSKLAILRHNLCFWIALFNLTFTIGGSMYTIYEERHDTFKIMKILSEITAMVSTMTKMIICRIEAPRIQFLIATMRTFLEQASRKEGDVIQGYVDKCLLPHTVVFISVILGPIAFIAGPLMTSQPFPEEIIYPFSTELNWIWATLYVSQSICIIQVGCMVIVDVLFAILLWYTGARFQMLCLEFQKATSADEISWCIQKHQELIGYVDQLKITTRIVALAVTAIALFVITTGGFILITNPPMYEVAKYIFYELAGSMQLFLFSWPADNLIDVSVQVGDAAYDCDWIGKPPEMLQNLMIVIQRSKNPMIISVDGFLPVLSLEFYGSSMAAAFSYLTTLRAIAAD